MAQSDINNAIADYLALQSDDPERDNYFECIVQWLWADHEERGEDPIQFDMDELAHTLIDRARMRT